VAGPSNVFRGCRHERRTQVLLDVKLRAASRQFDEQAAGLYKQQIKDLKLIPAGGGCFELTADGELLYSKLREGKFPDEQWVLDLLGTRLQKWA